MAWCRSNRSAAHAIGVFVPMKRNAMTTENTNEQTADGGTMNMCGDAHRGAVVARAQMELIDTLARLVLASVEQGAASVVGEPVKKRNEQRGNQKP